MESVDFTWNCLDREIQDEKQEEERESKEVERAYDKKMSISVRFSLMWQGCPIHNQSSNAANRLCSQTRPPQLHQSVAPPSR